MVNNSAIKRLEHKAAIDRHLLFRALLCLVVALGAALRLYDLGAESYWIDEISMIRVAGGSLESILTDFRENGRPPVFTLFVHYWMQVFGTSEIATRTPSALFGILSLVVLYTVGSELFDKRVALLGTFLMAISEDQIYHAQDFRYYSLFVLMTLLSILFYIRALKTRRTAYFAAYVLASLLLFFTHYFSVFVLAAQSLHFLLQWRRYRDIWWKWLFCQPLIFFAPFVKLIKMLIPLSERVRAGVAPGPRWIRDPQPINLLYTVSQYIFPNIPAWPTISVGVGLFLLGTLLYAVWQGKSQWLASVRGLSSGVARLSAQTSELLLVVLWFLFPIVLPFVLSKLLGPIYVDRYTISAAPALYLLIGLGMTTLARVVPEIVSAGLLMVLIVPGLYDYYVMPVKEQWRETAAYLTEHGQPGDVLIFVGEPHEPNQRTFSWYYRGGLPECDIIVERNGGRVTADALESCILDHQGFWLIVRGDPIRFQPAAIMPLFDADRHLTLAGEYKLRQVSIYRYSLQAR